MSNKLLTDMNGTGEKSQPGYADDPALTANGDGFGGGVLSGSNILASDEKELSF